MMSASGKMLRRQLRLGARAPRILVFLVLALTFLAAGDGAPAAAGSTVEDPLPGSSPHKKINRQINVFARMIDDVLIESDHALVERGRNTVGAYVPGQGAVFAFTFSLVGAPRVAGVRLDKLASVDELGVYMHDDGDVLVLPDDLDAEKLDDLKGRDEGTDRGKKVAALREKLAAERALRYIRVKEELAGVLAEYGDMLDAIPGNEWATLVARPGDGPWGEKKITTLVLRVRLADVKERVEGRTDDAAFRKKILVEEYGG